MELPEGGDGGGLAYAGTTGGTGEGETGKIQRSY